MSQVIKYVAGGGKTTFSINYLKEHKNGIYLAFNNKVVNEISLEGLMSKTIDSFFESYIIPKFLSRIPLINQGSIIEYFDENIIPNYLKGALNIKIDDKGNIYNKNRITCINLSISNKKLHEMDKFPNSNFIKYIFSKGKFRLSNSLRADISSYILFNYNYDVIEFIKSRFSYVIIDEAQDLNDYKENFAKLLHESSITTFILGDDDQNLYGGGKWFESLIPDKIQNFSHRCPEINCKWIRDNLHIEIYGDNKYGEFNQVSLEEIEQYNNKETVLLYNSAVGDMKKIVNDWIGKKYTIKTAKGMTIDSDIIIIGKSLNTRNYYTAITRSTKRVYSTIKKISY